jgi:hypothetical protein
MMDAGERELFAKAVESAVARGGAVDGALAELGGADALVEDERTAVSVLFEAVGRAGATSGALDLVLTRALGVEPAPIVLPAFGTTAPPGTTREGALEVDGLAMSALSGDVVLVPSRTDGGVAIVAADPSTLTVTPIHGLDPDLALRSVAGSLTPPPEFWPETKGREDDKVGPELVWGAALAAGQRGLAHQLVGASARMLELAREHALDRVQFGVPIASFQAIRHKLADTYVAIESARTALDAAWEEPSTANATAAKAIAGRAARLGAKHCQQVLAGIGFTVEHPLHTYLRRVRVLDGLLGDSRTLTAAIGAELVAAGGVPAILPLV